MSRMYCAANGTYIDVNVAGNVVLDKLAVGLPGNKYIGIPSIMTEEIAKLYAKRIRDALEKTKNGEILPEPDIPDHLKDAYKELFLGSMVTGGMINGRRLDIVENDLGREFLRLVADFFDQSGGMIDEDEYYDKYPSNRKRKDFLDKWRRKRASDDES